MKKSKKIILALFMLTLSLQFSGINQAVARVIIPPPPPTEPLAFVSTPSDFSCDSGDSISMTWKAGSGYPNGRSSNLYRSFDQSTWTLIASKGAWGDALSIIYSTTAPTLDYNEIDEVYYKIKVTDSSGSIYDIVKVTVHGPPLPLQIIDDPPSSFEHNVGDSIELQWTALSGYPLGRSSQLYQKFGQIWGEIENQGSWTNNEPVIYNIDTTLLNHDMIYTVNYRFHISDSSETKYDYFSINYFWDYDEDGMPNFWEDDHNLDKYDASDANEDLDNDTLVNLDEYLYNTNPLDWDSDNDLVPDGEEIYGLNTDPNKYNPPDCNFGNFEHNDSIGSAPNNWITVDHEIVVSQDPRNYNEKVLGLSISDSSYSPSAYVPISSGDAENDVYFSFEGAIYGSPIQDFNGRIALLGGGNFPNEINIIFDFFQEGLYLNDEITDLPNDGVLIQTITNNEFYLIEVLIHFVDDMNYNYKIWINNVLVYSLSENIWLEEIIPEFTITYIEVSGPLCNADFYLDNIMVSEARRDPGLENAITDEIYPIDYLLGGCPIVNLDSLEWGCGILPFFDFEEGFELSLDFEVYELGISISSNTDEEEIYLSISSKILIPVVEIPGLFLCGRVGGQLTFDFDFNLLKIELTFAMGCEYELLTFLTIGFERGIKVDDDPNDIFTVFIAAYLEIEILELSENTKIFLSGRIESGINLMKDEVEEFKIVPYFDPSLSLGIKFE